MKQSHAYRADIDGLRAIAVLLVVAFHAFPRNVKGGFIGVDVFFVISGFLITQIIVSDLAAGRFTLADFYARRARRIFPALATVVLVSLVVGLFGLFPGQLESLGKHALASALFVQNFVLLNEIDYFDTASDLKPLLHLWSLAVEEQFYLIWPLLLLVASRIGLSLIAVAVVTFVASFICNMMLVDGSSAAAFFLSPARFWELMAGAMLVVWPALAQALTATPARTETTGAAGAMLLAISPFVITSGEGFPGAWACLPVGGTALLIAAGPSHFIARHLLQARLLVQIGLISYPLYLWHWPILSFARNLQFKEPTALMKVVYIALAFAAAYATFRWIERPIRTGAYRQRAVLIASTSLALSGIAGLAIMSAQGFPARFPPEIAALSIEQRSVADTATRFGTCLVNSAAPDARFPAQCDGVGGPNAPRTALWGDSYAASLYPGLIDPQLKPANTAIAQYTTSGCPPIIGFSSNRHDCRRHSDAALARIAELKPQAVILAAKWDRYDGTENWGLISDAAFAATIAKLRQAGVQRIVTVGQFPVWSASVPKILARQYLTGAATNAEDARTSEFLIGKIFASDAQMKAKADSAGVPFISPLATQCNRDGCLLTVPNSRGVPTAWDNGHLTVAGSVYFATVNAAKLFGQ